MLCEKDPVGERRAPVAQVIQVVQVLNEGVSADQMRTGEMRRLGGCFWKIVVQSQMGPESMASEHVVI